MGFEKRVNLQKGEYVPDKNGVEVPKRYAVYHKRRENAALRIANKAIDIHNRMEEFYADLILLCNIAQAEYLSDDPNAKKTDSFTFYNFNQSIKVVRTVNGNKTYFQVYVKEDGQFVEVALKLAHFADGMTEFKGNCGSKCNEQCDCNSDEKSSHAESDDVTDENDTTVDPTVDHRISKAASIINAARDTVSSACDFEKQLDQVKKITNENEIEPNADFEKGEPSEELNKTLESKVDDIKENNNNFDFLSGVK